MANNDVQLDNQEVEETQAAPEPTTLAEAFQALRQDSAASAGDASQDIAGGQADVPEMGQGYDDLGGSELGDTSGDQVLGGNDGEDQDNLTLFDPNPARQEIVKSIQQEARAQVQKMFADAGVRLMDISDLYERDDGSGRVSFRNPDDPGRPFGSRYEAQQWVDSMNKQINSRFRQEIGKKQQEIAQQMLPVFALVDFAPQWQQMSKDEQDVFDAIIEPYAITGRDGKTIGFNCNLQAAARQAAAICQKFNSRQPQGFQQAAQQAPQKKQRQQQASMPALDAKTGNGTGDVDEPKTLEEAMLALRKGRK